MKLTIRRRVARVVLTGIAAASIATGATALDAGDASAGYTSTFGPYRTKAACDQARARNGAWISKSPCRARSAWIWYYTAQHI